ncbi:helix-turn-helix transcriptional regulator [Pseudobutyrivibrio xylanivorans]|uniref:Predicted DNA-binding transcriptional regulator YafY, contains an HTH and WYL domains n=1 Tax=Pseudobutyrivibrio xylanivorans TaxID=185007 RepID=A0A1G5S6Z4_PSEXY|nr:WYL domain-containing protein [Pseudobutyrivibrio xylanivorans]SCZ81339.1 Predicted DNA-binding transcriptional regulator YafY, contains an HTH and WYL domains [Pseudobutyrivibrio xylanivorans]
MRKSGLIDIYILEILEKYADKNHKMTQDKLLKLLTEEYGLECTRNTLSRYLLALRDEGYIAGERGVYKINKFSDEELRLLIDGVLFGQHIPAEDAKVMIEKLKSMSELGLKNRVKNFIYLEGLNRTQNKKLQDTLDIIDSAIQNNKKLRIVQAGFDIDTNNIINSGRELLVNPYYLVAEKSRYYLICLVEDEKENSHHGKELENLRIDRWWSVEETNIKRKKIESIPGYEHGFQLDEYMREHIYMWAGHSERVTLRINNYNVRDFVDWFGTEYRLIKKAEDYIEVSIKVNKNAIKYWALQYGGVATVLKPESLRKDILNSIEDMLKRYQEL